LLGGGVICIYILQIMRYSIKALERKAFYSLDEADFLNKTNREITIRIINKVKKNYDVINEKVDYMSMAQEFTQRLIWLLLAIGLTLTGCSLVNLIYPIVPSQILDFLKEYKADIFFFLIFLGVLYNNFR